MLERLGSAALFFFALVDHAGIPASWLGALWFALEQGQALWLAILLGICGGTCGDLFWWQMGRVAAARRPTNAFEQQSLLTKLTEAAARLAPVTAFDLLLCRLFPATNQFVMAAAGAGGRSLLSTAALSLAGNGLLFSAFGLTFGFWRANSDKMAPVGLLLALVGAVLLWRRWRTAPPR
jgi:membrane protein DedA with SNARE-associated domain